MGNVITFGPKDPVGPEMVDVPEASYECQFCEGFIYQLTDSGAWCLSCGGLNDWDDITETITGDDS